jgi:hypothetical protein
MHPDRLKKLARHLDALAARDRERIRREKEVESIRCDAAKRLHALCAAFAKEVNAVVTSVALEVSPAELNGPGFQHAGPNVFQIHVSGRVIQFVFEGTEPLLSTENLRTPYTLEGAVRWFNQDMLERDEIRDHRLYCCVEQKTGQWRFYDTRTNRTGPVDEEYLASLLEQLV